MAPTMIDGFAGVIAIEARAGGVIASVVPPLRVPDVALIVVLPIAVPDASPVAETPAMDGADEAQLTDVVRFCVVPSV